MKSYFRTTVTSGRFLVRDHAAFKNLRTLKDKTHEVAEWRPDGDTSEPTKLTAEEKQENRRQEHQFLLATI